MPAGGGGDGAVEEQQAHMYTMERKDGWLVLVIYI